MVEEEEEGEEVVVVVAVVVVIDQAGLPMKSWKPPPQKRQQTPQK